MIEWLLLPGNQIDGVRAVLGRAWRGTAQVRLLVPTAGAREVTVLVPETATALRQPRWPDVLSDWVDIYEEALFPSPLLPVAGEVISEQVCECLALHADLGDHDGPDGARGGIAWYEKGGVTELEQVGKAAVAWRKGQPLSRPTLSGARTQLASLGRSMSSTAAEAGLYDRVSAGLHATTEAVLARALIRLLGEDPPPLPAMARAVLSAGGHRLTF